MITGNKSIPSHELKSVISKQLARGSPKHKADQIRVVVENYYKKQGYFLPVANVTAGGKAIYINIIEVKLERPFCF